MIELYDDLYEFDKSIEIGERGESFLISLLSQYKSITNIIDVTTNPMYQQQDIDYILNYNFNNEETEISIEIKSDTYDSGNIFFENVSCVETNSLGCMLKTQADYIFYYLITTNELYILNRKMFVEWVETNYKCFHQKSLQNKRYDGSSYTSKGCIIPKKYIDKNFARTSINSYIKANISDNTLIIINKNFKEDFDMTKFNEDYNEELEEELEEEMEEVLREGQNELIFAGAVKSHELEEAKDKNGNSIIRGKFTLKCVDSEPVINVYTSKYTQSNSVRKTYEFFKKLIDKKLLTVANAHVEKGEYPVAVKIFGNDNWTAKLRENRYASKRDANREVKTSLQYQFGSATIVEVDGFEEEIYQLETSEDGVDSLVYLPFNEETNKGSRAEFELEMYIKEIKEETKKAKDEDGDEVDQETGRVLITGYVPGRSGKDIMEVTVVTTLEDEFSQDVKDVWEDGDLDKGDTVIVRGILDNRVTLQSVKEKTKRRVLGKEKKQEKKTYINELVCTGLEFIEENDAFDKELIEKALKERAMDMEEIKAKAMKEDEGNKKSSKGIIRNSKNSETGGSKKLNIADKKKRSGF